MLETIEPTRKGIIQNKLYNVEQDK